MSFLGADTQQLMDHATRMGQQAQGLTALRARLDPLVMAEDAWQGPDAELFRQRWASEIAPRIETAGQHLSERSQRLIQQAHDQDEVSNSDEQLIPGMNDPISAGGDGLAAGEQVGMEGWGMPDRPYDYHRDYEVTDGIEDPGVKDEYPTGEEIWPEALKEFSKIFPIPGMPDNPKPGDTFNLAGFPVRITAVGPRSLTLESLPGHIEGAGNTITFELSPDGRRINVDAKGPKGPSYPNVLPGIFWPMLAANMGDFVRCHQELRHRR